MSVQILKKFNNYNKGYTFALKKVNKIFKIWPKNQSKNKKTIQISLTEKLTKILGNP